MRLTTTAALAALPLLAAPILAAQPVAAGTVAVTPAGAWDFDGDRILDLAGGDPGHEEGGPGQVLVRRGTGDGYGPALVLHHPNAPEGNDAFGASVASADLDHDGYADLVVGAPSYYAQRDGFGSVTVFRGSATGLSQAASTSIVWPRRTDGDLVAFGRSVVLTDLNGDGWTDIAVGAPDDDGDRGTDHSRLQVLRGGPAGFAQERYWTVMPPSGTRWFGAVLAAGDIDGDGHVDLIESGNYPEQGSHITFMRGTDTGPHRARVISTGWAQSLAVGEVTGDGYPDVVAGRPFGRYDNTVRRPYVGAGRVTLFRGSADGPRTGVTVTQESPGVPGSSQYRDFFGASVAVVDVNDSGRNEVVVGVPGADVGSVKDAGSVTVLRVGATGFRRHGNRVVTAATPGVPGDPIKFGNFGSAVAAQDRTRDGLPDLLAAARGGYGSPRLLTVLRVIDAPLLAGGVTTQPVLDGDLPRDGSSG